VALPLPFVSLAPAAAPSFKLTLLLLLSTNTTTSDDDVPLALTDQSNKLSSASKHFRLPFAILRFALPFFLSLSLLLLKTFTTPYRPKRLLYSLLGNTASVLEQQARQQAQPGPV
jgi:hypothetical protein